jgi:hypothetical protein
MAKSIGVFVNSDMNGPVELSNVTVVGSFVNVGESSTPENTGTGTRYGICVDCTGGSGMKVIGGCVSDGAIMNGKPVIINRNPVEPKKVTNTPICDELCNLMPPGVCYSTEKHFNICDALLEKLNEKATNLSDAIDDEQGEKFQALVKDLRWQLIELSMGMGRVKKYLSKMIREYAEEHSKMTKFID